MRRYYFRILLIKMLLPVALFGQAPTAGKNTISLRGKPVDIYFYPAAKGSGGPVSIKILYTPGNAGMKRMAVDMAQKMAAWGYDIYGLDVKAYLESFTSADAKLKDTDVMADYREIARWITKGKTEPVLLVGWSQGAGMNLLAGMPAENKKVFSGMICIGLGPENVLGWKLADDIADAFRKMPNEPKFQSANYLPKITVLPFYWIQSSRDEWTTLEQTKTMFALAPEPKKLILIQAENHHFKNHVDEFYQALSEGIKWISQSSH